MGSSPVTATIPRDRPPARGDDVDPRRPLVARLAAELGAVPVRPGELLLVAFSGGPDSTALLLGLSELAPRRGWRLLAAHVDHRLDPGSGERARVAAGLARQLDVELLTLRPEQDADPPSAPFAIGSEGDTFAPGLDRDGETGGGPEAAARRLRYRLLDGLRRERGARWLLTAHHADDQVETVLLRLRQGSGIAGLAAMSAQRGPLLRPLLLLRRAELAAAVRAARLVAVHDPGNDDTRLPRNLLRRELLPRGGQRLGDAALALAAAAAGARSAIERRVSMLAPASGDERGPRLPLADLRALPSPLVPWALAELHRRAGLPYPPRAAAVAELRRQLAGGGRVGCHCAAGWRWRGDGPWLRLLPPSPTTAPGVPFAYTLAVPGRVEIREAATTFHLARRPLAEWLSADAGTPLSGCRVALDLPLSPGDLVTVRSRRPGDRLRPLGAAHHRGLKQLLIDRRVPRDERARLPLLCVGDQVAWVPGVTAHHDYRLRPDDAWAWVAELSAPQRASRDCREER